MARIHLEIEDTFLKEQVDRLLGSEHEIRTFVPGKPSSPDLVLTDSTTLLGTAADFKKMERPVLSVCAPESDPQDLATFDDFIVLPVDPVELLLRIEVVLASKAETEKGLVVVDGLRVNAESYEVFADDELLDLTYKEFELLKYLIENPGIVLTRDKLLDKVWGYEYFGGTRTVDVHIRRLRSKLGVKYEEYIETIRNVGYRFRKMRR